MLISRIMKIKFFKLLSLNVFFLTIAGGRRMSERDMTRVGNEAHSSGGPGPQLLNNSKSVPTLHHIGEFL